MDGRRFLGYPPYLEQAARELGHTGAVDIAPRVPTLAALANLCAQAAASKPDRAGAILAHARALLGQLRLACRAGELMLDAAAPASRPHGPRLAPLVGGATPPRTPGDDQP
jgi:hypothetical protein